jgi:hypothetical protein
MADKNAQEMIAPSSGVHIILPDYYSPEGMGLIVPKPRMVVLFLCFHGWGVPLLELQILVLALHIFRNHMKMKYSLYWMQYLTTLMLRYVVPASIDDFLTRYVFSYFLKSW